MSSKRTPKRVKAQLSKDPRKAARSLKLMAQLPTTPSNHTKQPNN